jgi:hypothetical protein
LLLLEGLPVSCCSQKGPEAELLLLLLLPLLLEGWFEWCLCLWLLLLLLCVLAWCSGLPPLLLPLLLLLSELCEAALRSSCACRETVQQQHGEQYCSEHAVGTT